MTYKVSIFIAKVCGKRQVSEGVCSIYGGCSCSRQVYVCIIYRSKSAGEYPLQSLQLCGVAIMALSKQSLSKKTVIPYTELSTSIIRKWKTNLICMKSIMYRAWSPGITTHSKSCQSKFSYRRWFTSYTITIHNQCKSQRHFTEILHVDWCTSPIHSPRETYSGGGWWCSCKLYISKLSQYLKYLKSDQVFLFQYLYIKKYLFIKYFTSTALFVYLFVFIKLKRTNNKLLWFLCCDSFLNC